MKSLRLWLVVLLAVLLQSTYIAAWRPWGLVPELVIIVMVSVATSVTASQALLAAVISGALLDLTAGGPFGLRISYLLVLVLALIWLRQRGVVFNLLIYLFAVAVATVLFGVVQIATLALYHANLTWGAASIVFGTALITTILGGILHPLLTRIIPVNSEIVGGGER